MLSKSNNFSIDVMLDTNVSQSSINGIDMLIYATTSFPADHVTITSISNQNELKYFDMHGGTYEWYFKANFYIKGTYEITVTAYNSRGESVSDTITYTY